ncbi:hypothetical protein [Bifidobacterium choloepi]|uniref:Uncharacterized protein n=1 Tax=Bifidobacterium choloepi TaxID=2614131 RepID=A0A6I5NF91_9BIFI|nr:hypothetical protein [Bifidobacterium choloepi]NEG70004.1 hypothetical protein [Bifidobacterium choloepi]
MSATEWTVTVIVVLAGLVAGLAMGALPLRSHKMTEQQNKFQQLAGIAAVGVVVVLIMLDFQVAGWAIIAALLVGGLVANIPPVHRLLLAHFPELRPAEEASPLKRVRKK